MQDSEVNASASTNGAKLPAKEDPAAEQDEDKYRFGCGPCSPAILQKIFRNAAFFSFLLCLYAIVEGSIVSGSISIVVTSLETRYKFSTFQVGIIVLMSDVAVLLSVVFVSYFGEQSHKPRWLGVGLLFQALSCFMFALPQWVYGRYSAGISGELKELCDLEGMPYSGLPYSGSGDNGTDEDCMSPTEPYPAALAIFVMAAFVLGLGISPLFTIGTTFMDDIIRPKFVPLVLGAFYISTILGPVLGFVIGGAILNNYVDIGVETELTPDDPAWVGRWWLPFLISGVASLLLAVPFFMFPRQLPNSAAIKAERQKEMAKVLDKDLTREMNFKEKLKVFPKHLKLLIFSPAYMSLCFAIGALFIILNGFIQFFPKYLETQYAVTASLASFIIGVQGVIGSIVGNILGGVIVFLFKIRGRKLILMVVIIQTIIVPLTFVFLLHCPTVQIPGVTADGSKNDTCNLDCNCDESLYEPVCGADNYTHLTPCLAGCLIKEQINDSDITFRDCGCINSTNQTATDGVCDTGCWYIFPIVVVSWFVGILMNSVRLLVIFSTLRIVAEEQRSLGLGLQTIIWRIGGIIGPLITGSLFDASCEHWQMYEECDTRGNCWVYNTQTLAYRIVGFFSITLAIVAIFYGLTWLTYPKGKAELEEVEAHSKDGGPPISAANAIALNEAYEKGEAPDGDQKVENV